MSRAKVSKALIRLRDEGPIDVMRGICWHVGDILTPETAESLEAAFMRWPEFSGSPSYPVPHPSMPAASAYINCRNVWTGAYGAARRRLLHFLIEEFS